MWYIIFVEVTVYKTEEVAKFAGNTLGTFRNYWIPKLRKAGIVPEKLGQTYLWTAEQVEEIKKIKGINNGQEKTHSA